MDKKFTIIGVIFILTAIVLGVQASRQQQKFEQYKKDHPEQFAAKPAATAGTSAAPASTAGTATSGATGTAAAPTPAPAVAAAAPTNNGTLAWLTPSAPLTATAPVATRELANDYVDVTLTENGGAIKSVTLKKFPAQLGSDTPLVFNAKSPQPALALCVPDPARANETTYWAWMGSKAQAMTGSPRVPPSLLLGLCKIDESLSSNTSVTFRGTTPDGLEFTRTYTLSSGSEDAYLIHHTTTIVNHGTNTAPLNRLFVNAGMAPPPPPDASALVLSYHDFAYFNGESASFVTVSEFMDSPDHIFGLIKGSPKQKNYVYAERSPADLQWVSVKDPYFATVLMPKGVLGSGFFVQGVEVKNDGDAETTVTGDLELNLGALAPGAEKKLEMDYYVGPKEYVRLDRMGDHQDLVMQFGWFGGFSKILLLALIAIHKAIASLSPTWGWGWTIIIFTIIIKGVTWPLTAVQVRSARRMQQFQGPLKEIREKYKDNPQKMQAETMELYRKHKINPVAGCLPLLISFPIFLAFNSMMRTASEFRFQSFFWIHDLSMTDTVGHIGGFAINIMPLLMGVTMLVQTHMMPSPSADATQQRIMKFMPVMFIGFFYTMPAGMNLYWTCNNLFTILQQYLTRRKMDEPMPVAATGQKSKRR